MLENWNESESLLFLKEFVKKKIILVMKKNLRVHIIFMRRIKKKKE